MKSVRLVTSSLRVRSLLLTPAVAEQLIALPDTLSLPSACSTRQSPKYTRQRLCRVPHSAKGTRQKINRQRCLCRVLFVGHSAKPLPSARKTLGKDLHSAKIYTRQNENAKKNPKIIAIFFSGEAATGQCPSISIEVAVIFEQISRLMWLVGFELTTSPSCVCCSTTALHCHLYLDSVIYPHILY